MPLSSARRAAYAPPWATFQAAALDWAHTDGVAWLYVVKALAAAFLALGVSMKLDLPQPKTAMTTVFIVMQPRSGAVFAKSFYRLCGTFIGLIAILLFFSLFSQQRLLFLLAMALWLALCTAGAARNRNFRSYGFLLAGYTSAIIGLPGSQHPDDIFLTALTRVSEITIGILSGGIVSALLFPQYTTERMRTTIRERFGRFVDYVTAAFSSSLDCVRVEQTNLRFVSDVIGFETDRSMAVFESPSTRMKDGRLANLNSEFMAASSRFHALHQLIKRLRANHADAVLEAIEPYFKESMHLLLHNGQPINSAINAAQCAPRLFAYRETLAHRLRATGDQYAAQENFPQLDFDTAAELLYRFISDIHTYTVTYASLAYNTTDRERWIQRYQPRTNTAASLVAGARTAIIILVLSSFWIASGWPSGATFVMNSAAVCSLSSAMPEPSHAINRMAVGTTLAAVLGFILMFGIYPHIDSFVLLCVALTPFLILGIVMSLRPAWAGYSMGYCIFLCTLAGPENIMHYDPQGFMNDAIALVLSMLMSALGYYILFPTSAPWLKNWLFADLRKEAIQTCYANLTGLRTRLESGTRDLLFQIHALAAKQPDEQRRALHWMFAVLEIGNAIIDLRSEMAALPRAATYDETAPWHRSITALRYAVAMLFDKPCTVRFDTALHCALQAIAVTHKTLTILSPPPEERHRLRHILSHLHVVRTTLLDPESPFAPFNRTPTPTARPLLETHYAAP